MIKQCTVLIVLFLLIFLWAQALGDNRYTAYMQIERHVTELDWRLVQVNLKLAESAYFVYFDSETSIFKVDKFVDTYTLSTMRPTALREVLVADSRLVEAVIGSEFPEFRQYKDHDLQITFTIGEPSARLFATYSGGNLKFADAYYDFRKEIDG